MGAMVTLAQVAADPRRARALCGAGRCRRRFGQPADPQRGDARRQPAAAAALLVLPFGARTIACARAATTCFAFARREPIPRHVRPERLRHGAPVDRGDRAGRVRRAASSSRCTLGQARRRAGGVLSAARAGHHARERSRRRARCSPRSAAAGARRALGASAPGRAGVVRLADRRRRGGARDGRAASAGARRWCSAPRRRSRTGRSEAEAALAGKRIDEAAARGAARAALAGAMPLRDNAYKLPIFEALVRRAILAAAGR